MVKYNNIHTLYCTYNFPFFFVYKTLVGNAGLLISPSICETFGIYQSDLYQKRSQGEILALFETIGSNVTKDDLEKIWSTVAGQKKI